MYRHGNPHGFRQARVAMTLRSALECDLTGMAYEAWFVLDCHADGIRRLVGMPQPKR
jgi:hypothetical protein